MIRRPPRSTLFPTRRSSDLGVTVDIEVTDEAVEITATARTADRTGVEMEALTSVAVAGLTVIDMVKAVDPRAAITDVRLLAKSGGKSGRSEEHTSELQSRQYLVCRLLLEKKKKNNNYPSLPVIY